MAHPPRDAVRHKGGQGSVDGGVRLAQDAGQLRRVDEGRPAESVKKLSVVNGHEPSLARCGRRAQPPRGTPADGRRVPAVRRRLRPALPRDGPPSTGSGRASSRPAGRDPATPRSVQRPSPSATAGRRCSLWVATSNPVQSGPRGRTGAGPSRSPRPACWPRPGRRQ